MSKKPNVIDVYLQPGYNEVGQEIPDPNPIEVPAHLRRPKSIEDRIRAVIESERARAVAESQGFETFEEANDFNVGDDDEFVSQYELREMREEPAPAQPISKPDVKTEKAPTEKQLDPPLDKK